MKAREVDVALPVKLLNYVDDLVRLEGWGSSRAEVVRNIVWQEVHRLIVAGRLTETPGDKK